MSHSNFTWKTKYLKILTRLCLLDMTIVLPRTLTRDLEKFDQRDFAAVPKWAILRNHSGLQVQLFWEAKTNESNESEHSETQGFFCNFLFKKKIFLYNY